MAKTDEAKTTEPVEENKGDKDSAPARAKAAAAAEGADTRPLREDLPTNDEPDIPFTAGAEELFNRPVQVPPATLAPSETIQAPRAPEAVAHPRLRRLVTEADVATPGFKALSSHAKDSFETLVLRPGDRVVGPMLVVGLNDIDHQIELMPGAVVPDGDTGYVPVNYMLDSHQSQRALQRAAERAAGNRP